jgi:acyl-CoA synthetase (NDP forming)
MNHITKTLLGILASLFTAGAIGWASWMSNAVVDLKTNVAELRAELRSKHVTSTP